MSIMTDQRKLTVALASALTLTAMVLLQNLSGDLLAGLEERWKRQRRYEKVIEPKGLGLHRGMYWKEKE